MMGPATLTTADYPVAQKPAVGIDKLVYVSVEHAVEIGQFEILGANSGQYTPDPVNVPAATGQEIIAVVDSDGGMNGGATNVVLTLTGTDTADAAITLTATFQPPGYAKDQTKIFQCGYAVDALEASSKLVKTVTGGSVTCAASAKGAKIKFYAMPALATFKQIGCATDVRFSGKSAMPVAIACGRNPSAFVKPGRPEVPRLTVNGKLFGFGEGLARYSGWTGTYLLKNVKEGKVHTDSVYFIEATLKVDPDLPDDGEDTIAGEGMFEQAAYMVAM